jgi:hypothetical protein
MLAFSASMTAMAVSTETEQSKTSMLIMISMHQVIVSLIIVVNHYIVVLQTARSLMMAITGLH